MFGYLGKANFIELNFCILQMKWYMYVQKLKGQKLDWCSFIRFIKSEIEIEMFIRNIKGGADKYNDNFDTLYDFL